jgi:hypothetical protein
MPTLRVFSIVTLGAGTIVVWAASLTMAAAPVPNQYVYGCVARSGGDIRITSAPHRCKVGEYELKWSRYGSAAGAGGSCRPGRA